MNVATIEAFLVASGECDRARVWYRLTCSDADLFASRASRAFRAGEIDDARAYTRQFVAASEARRAAWTQYRRTVATLARIAGERAG